jgi:hypothetical protein
MPRIFITINEDGTLSVKTECEVGEEETSLEEIREMFRDIADVREIIRDPPKQPDSYQSYMEDDSSGVSEDDSVDLSEG